jgi:hypothetical protein
MQDAMRASRATGDICLGRKDCVSYETTQTDGKKIQPFGSKRVGILMSDPEINGVQGTPEEYKAAVNSCNPQGGRYSVDGGNFV